MMVYLKKTSFLTPQDDWDEVDNIKLETEEPDYDDAQSGKDESISKGSFKSPVLGEPEKMCTDLQWNIEKNELHIEGHSYLKEIKPSGGRQFWNCARKRSHKCSARAVTAFREWGEKEARKVFEEDPFNNPGMFVLVS